MTLLLDPTSEREPTGRQRTPRPATLHGRRVGLLDISKPRGNVFLDRLEERLGAHGCTVTRYTKLTFSKPATIDLRQRIATECDLLIEALAD